MKQLTESYQVVVVGGGLAGFCAAVASARQGAATCLVQNRPVFGGNSSSEVRVTPHGAAAFHAYARETGIISELLIEERAVNHEAIFENGWTNSVWDLVMYDLARTTPNLTCHLNTDVQQVHLADARTIDRVVGRVQNAEVELHLAAQIFIDCTGDGTVAAAAGCEWRLGSESKSEFDEPHAPELASLDVMGNSIHFKTKDMGRPVPFKAPDWAMKYDDASFFYQQGRPPKEVRGGYWWLEIGVPFDTLHDNETIRHELTRHALGVWDWMKNRDPVVKEQARNYALDWVGQVPGKRESRRIMGQYLMTEHDPQNRTVFDDEIAFGGWFIDLHTPGGLLAAHSEPASGEDYNTFSEYAVKSYAGPYGIPLRSLIAKDVDNLMMAGRNVSVTHAALGTVRVMGTTALMGQAAGTAAAVALQQGLALSQVPARAIDEVQQRLLRAGCFLPNYRNQDPADLARAARATASSEAREEGAGPTTPGYEQGLHAWRDQPQYRQESLTQRRGQVLALGGAELRSVGLYLRNTAAEAQTLRVRLVEVAHIWDYRVHGLPELAQGQLLVPAGHDGWVDWPLHLTDMAPGRLLRVEALPNPALEWQVAGKIVTGQLGQYQIGDDKMRRFGHGETLSFRVSPAQACYGPANVLSGVSRPYQFTNLWKSAPQQALPQWLRLQWAAQQTIRQVELTFPGHLIREYHAYDPLYRDPQCPRDYALQAWVDGAWVELLAVEDNYQRHRRHALPQAVTTSQLRVLITATNGDPSAQIYEIRCY